MLGKRPRLDHVADAHGRDRPVRHLDADDGDLVRNRRDAHAARAEREGDVVGEIRNLAELHTLIERELIARDARAVDDLARLRIHAEALERLGKAARVAAQLRAHLGVVLRVVLVEQRDGRIAVFVLRLCQLVLNGAADLLGGGLHIRGRVLPLRGGSGCGRLRRLLRRGRGFGCGRGLRLRAQHLVRRPDVLSAAGEELPLRRGLEQPALRLLLRQRFGLDRLRCGRLVDRDVDGAPSACTLRRGQRRGGLFLLEQARLLVLGAGKARALAALTRPLRHLLRRLAQHQQHRPRQQQRQQHARDDGAEARLQERRKSAGERAAAAQRQPVDPQVAQRRQSDRARCIRHTAQQQVQQAPAQHGDRERPRHAQAHRAPAVADEHDAHHRERRRPQPVAVPRQTLEELFEQGQEKCLHAEIADQHAQRQQQTHEAPHLAADGARLLLRRRSGLFSGLFLLCSHIASFPRKCR